MQPHTGELFKDGLVGDLQSDHFLWLNFQISQQLDLLKVEGAAVKDPTVQAAVRLAQPLVDQVNHNIIRDDAILSDVALELASVVVIVVAPCHFFDQLGDLNVDNLVLLGDAECVLFLLRTWGAHQDNPLGSSGSVRVIQLQNAVDLFNDSHLRLIALKLRDETLANVLDSLQLKIVFENGVTSESIAKLRIIDDAEAWLGLLIAEVPTDGSMCLAVLLVEQDELVGDHAHLLECDRLRLRPREALNDPALLTSLHLLNLLLDKFDHDLVLYVTVGFQRLFNVLTILLVLLSDLSCDKVTD